MNLELSEDEAELLKALLLAERDEERVELHHAKNIEFKAALHTREQLIQSLLKRM